MGATAGQAEVGSVCGGFPRARQLGELGRCRAGGVFPAGIGGQGYTLRSSCR